MLGVAWWSCGGGGAVVGVMVLRKVLWGDGGRDVETLWCCW